jgi:hypothetical protein
MPPRKVIFLLPLVTVALTVLNSSSFVFLATNDRLALYIVCSSIYSLTTWISHWFIPSVFSFEEEKLPEIRQLQWTALVLGIFLVNLLAPSTVSIAFSAVLIAEIFFFHSGLLVIHSKTATFHFLEIGRSVLNICNLLICIYVFRGEPTFLVIGMTFNVVVTGAISYRLGNRAPVTRAAGFSRTTLAQVSCAALVSRNTRFMMLARLLEISAIVAFTYFENLSALIAVKLSVMVAQATSLNARDVAWPYILIFSVVFFTTALAIIIILDGIRPEVLPPALQTLTWNSLIAGLIFQVPFSILLSQSLAKPLSRNLKI